jgi:hypothetical protein
VVVITRFCPFQHWPRKHAGLMRCAARRTGTLERLIECCASLKGWMGRRQAQAPMQFLPGLVVLREMPKRRPDNPLPAWGGCAWAMTHMRTPFETSQ